MGIIDRCVCSDITFTELSRRARAGKLSLEQLCERTGCGSSCALCLPYLREMLATGRTSFNWSPPKATESEPVRRRR